MRTSPQPDRKCQSQLLRRRAMPSRPRTAQRRRKQQLSCAAGVGKVEKNGPGATKFKVGQRVVGVPWPGAPEGNGTWQQFYVAPEGVLVSPLCLELMAPRPLAGRMWAHGSSQDLQRGDRTASMLLSMPKIEDLVCPAATVADAEPRIARELHSSSLPVWGLFMTLQSD